MQNDRDSLQSEPNIDIVYEDSLKEQELKRDDDSEVEEMKRSLSINTPMDFENANSPVATAEDFELQIDSTMAAIKREPVCILR